MDITALLNPYEPCSKHCHWKNSKESDMIKCSSDTIITYLKTYDSSHCVRNSSFPTHDAEKVMTISFSPTTLDCPPIKSLYNTYTTQKISDKVDCEHQASLNAPSHFHVINLIEHALEGNDALMFHMHMKLLKATCALLPNNNLQRLAYPENLPKTSTHQYVKH